MKPKLLIVDDDTDMLAVCRDILAESGHLELRCQSDPKAGLEVAESETLDLVISDLKMPGMDGLAFLTQVRVLQPGAGLMLVTAHAESSSVQASIGLGLCDYLTKPFTPEQLRVNVERLLARKRLEDENRLLRRLVFSPGPGPEGMIAASAAMARVTELMDKVAHSDVDALITGESGTGKELVARGIHLRAGKGEFVAVDCGAIPENLMESEFFGHEKGSFTGADSTRMGLLEFADGGVLFLDEVAELSRPMQAKLLRVLQERSYRRVGGRRLLHAKLRVLAATNKDLKAEVEAGRFREDLYFRLGVISIHVPPLRERVEEIPSLAALFLAKHGKPGLRVSEDAWEVLSGYAWPGNVRELQNVLRRAAVLCPGDEIHPEDLPPELVESAGQNAPAGFFAARARALQEFERAFLADALRKSGGKVSEAAKSVNMPRGTFYRLLKKRGLDPSGFAPGEKSGEKSA